MNISVRAESLPIESVRLKGNDAGRVDLTAQPGSGLTSLAMVLALSFGGVLTLAWAGALLWFAAYVIGIW